MRRSSDSAQTEPLAALVAVLAVVAAVGTYATVYGRALPGQATAQPTATLDHVADEITAGGVARPAKLANLERSAGLSLNVTLRAATRAWSVGPRPPRDAPAAARPLPVRTGGRVAFGRLRVVVWT
ncbi:DUF7285 family protein [Halocalculus aciditolerans]|uniref:Uncharacterized protein n=1 Tax=Halocalculus aciditolerans TaxID=1383812 RepID=A0A830FP51_9EURY|nr:hypothetical protein [Halocalculus aciditolerans]GGL72556.1 hypothetical protein GCM10009039_33160 [Halocalculus aciditolerans]